MNIVSSTEVIGANAAANEHEEHGIEPCPFVVAGDNIVVELVEREETTDSGIVLVEDKKARPSDVTVVGIGPAAARYFSDNERFNVNKGSVLVVRKHEMLRLELSEDGRELHVLKPASVLGMIPK